MSYAPVPKPIGPITHSPFDPNQVPVDSPTPIWYGESIEGTYYDFWDLAQARIPGMHEATRGDELQAALNYWTTELASPTSQWTTLVAQKSVDWLTAELERQQNPPPNTLHIVYPV